MALHTGKKKSETCKFCGSQISAGRIQELEDHFNDAYRVFLGGLDGLAKSIRDWRTTIEEIELPNKAQFYDAFASAFATSRTDFLSFSKTADNYLEALEKQIEEKRRRAFEKMTASLPPCPDGVAATNAVATMNEAIDSHNKETDGFQKSIASARKSLEGALVAEALPQFKKKTEAITNALADEVTADGEVKRLVVEIENLEKEIVESRKPAEQLTAELRSYVGRDELKFEFKESGYEITRHGAPALNLSEGERTAVAFLYFLKTLEDKGFNLPADIVVIDDPVSSLDMNALFCAFGYMKERTKGAGQLFVLTHNFGLFRQVKNWFKFVNGREKDPTKWDARFFMMDTTFLSGRRNAAIGALDPLLYEYESEYHYLFKKVYDCTTSGAVGSGLERFYSTPNIARRLLESFLCFRFPALAGELSKQLDQVSGFDTAKKARILRFLHTYSHDGKVAEPEHDLTILSETPQIMTDLLDLIKHEDGKHYKGMVDLVK
jgi:wobble nucleotide-excising tRNase